MKSSKNVTAGKLVGLFKEIIQCHSQDGEVDRARERQLDDEMEEQLFEKALKVMSPEEVLKLLGSVSPIARDQLLMRLAERFRIRSKMFQDRLTTGSYAYGCLRDGS